ncbi:hypothetical protein [Kribbella speibonae]|uniref:GNAT family N-acetyltransferase n=1 Tax=Kribbella speibonae TaxID=1572660 RepID=A0ABY2A0N0_9ACTN|nr:hypothetical protein [Kribbella speibonae]TCC20342.1 hypothetical protein E0H58_29950 [Kribbella speibonae]
MVNVRPAGPDAWSDVQAVMGERGDPSRCFCQYFRLRGKAWSASSPENNRAGLKSQVCDGERAPGVLAYDGSAQVGWCAVGPRTSYPRVEACAVDTAVAGRIPSADLYRGPLSVYLDAGFTEVSRTSPQWVLVRSAV